MLRRHWTVYVQMLPGNKENGPNKIKNVNKQSKKFIDV